MMPEIILHVENLSKQYRLGSIGTGTLSHDLNRWWYKLRGKDDPYMKIGESNDRSTNSDSEYIWALKDINFQLNKGDVLGIIGKNGAGKSTLLKILSKVTGPTSGSIKFNGRIASLLEVGTGFHPEMTGLENIFLNGAILGMTKNEIKLKLESIISFSGCRRYIDTPVKRYSSGMKVRLAFAVAAFLEPDILIVDEVLAVGDREFQKKALTKIQDISYGEGRTVIFVSHNMGSILNLCTRCICLDKGKVIADGKTDFIIDKYININVSNRKHSYQNTQSEKQIYFKNIDITDEFSEPKTLFKIQDTIYIKIVVNKEQWKLNFLIGLGINDKYDKRLMIDIFNCDINTNNDGSVVVMAIIEKGILTPGIYNCDLSIMDNGNRVEELLTNIVYFEIDEISTHYAELNYDYGYIQEKISWTL